MESILKSTIPDKCIIYSLIAMIITKILFITFKNKEIREIVKKVHWYIFLWIVIIVSSTVYIVYKYAINHISLLLIIFLIISIYCICHILKIINPKYFKNTNFSLNDLYVITFIEIIYFIFFSKIIYLKIIDNIPSINNEFLTDSFLLFYMTLKFTLFLCFSILNITLSLKNIFNLLFIKCYDFMKELKNNIINYNIVEIENNDIRLLIQKNKPLKYTTKNKYLFYIKTPLLILLFYIVEITKILLTAILNLFIIPIDFFIKMLSNEIIFLYKLLFLCILISITLMYGHILNHNIFNEKSIKLFELIAFTISFTMITQQLNKVKNYKEKLKK